MEEKKKKNEKEVAMVECPFCNKPIEAPAKADVIFECPHCHKELITYDKTTEKRRKLEPERMKQKQEYKKYKNLFKWGSIAAIIILFICTRNVTSNDIQIIGTWYDRAVPGSFYELYEKDGKIHLNYANIKDIPCDLYTITGNEFTFRNDKSGTFALKPGTSIYIGEGFEEAVDVNGKSYQSKIILLIQNRNLSVYTNDYDKNIYDILCVATQ